MRILASYQHSSKDVLLSSTLRENLQYVANMFALLLGMTND